MCLPVFACRAPTGADGCRCVALQKEKLPPGAVLPSAEELAHLLMSTMTEVTQLAAKYAEEEGTAVVDVRHMQLAAEYLDLPHLKAAIGKLKSPVV